MKQQYDIKFLSNEDFENMPVSDRLGEDVSDSFGVYNPHTGQIRIRDTGFWEVNKYLLDHELEHAVEEHATDTGPNGLRHKKGKKFFKDIFLPLTTGINRKGKFSPFNPLRIWEDPMQKQKDAESQSKMLGKRGMGNFLFPDFQELNTPAVEGGGTQSNLNQGLNQQSTNPLDPYAQYGQQTGTQYY